MDKQRKIKNRHKGDVDRYQEKERFSPYESLLKDYDDTFYIFDNLTKRKVKNPINTHNVVEDELSIDTTVGDKSYPDTQTTFSDLENIRSNYKELMKWHEEESEVKKATKKIRKLIVKNYLNHINSIEEEFESRLLSEYEKDVSVAETLREKTYEIEHKIEEEEKGFPLRTSKFDSIKKEWIPLTAEELEEVPRQKSTSINNRRKAQLAIATERKHQTQVRNRLKLFLNFYKEILNGLKLKKSKDGKEYYANFTQEDVREKLDQIFSSDHEEKIKKIEDDGISTLNTWEDTIHNIGQEDIIDDYLKRKNISWQEFNNEIIPFQRAFVKARKMFYKEAANKRVELRKYTNEVLNASFIRDIDLKKYTSNVRKSSDFSIAISTGKSSNSRSTIQSIVEQFRISNNSKLNYLFDVFKTSIPMIPDHKIDETKSWKDYIGEIVRSEINKETGEKVYYLKNPNNNSDEIEITDFNKILSIAVINKNLGKTNYVPKALFGDEENDYIDHKNISGIKVPKEYEKELFINDTEDKRYLKNKKPYVDDRYLEKNKEAQQDIEYYHNYDYYINPNINIALIIDFKTIKLAVEGLIEKGITRKRITNMIENKKVSIRYFSEFIIGSDELGYVSFSHKNIDKELYDALTNIVFNKVSKINEVVKNNFAKLSTDSSFIDSLFKEEDTSKYIQATPDHKRKVYIPKSSLKEYKKTISESMLRKMIRRQLKGSI